MNIIVFFKTKSTIFALLCKKFSNGNSNYLTLAFILWNCICSKQLRQ